MLPPLGLTYIVVGRMREQSPIDLLLEQHWMISVGSFVGAALGAWLGQLSAARRKPAADSDSPA